MYRCVLVCSPSISVLHLWVKVSSGDYARKSQTSVLSGHRDFNGFRMTGWESRACEGRRSREIEENHADTCLETDGRS